MNARTKSRIGIGMIVTLYLTLGLLMMASIGLLKAAIVIGGTVALIAYIYVAVSLMVGRP